MRSPRITISGKQLASVISVWLRRAPKWVWGKDPAYERLRAQKRHDPAQEPDPRKEVAALIAAELDRLDWQVTYEAPEPPGSPPAQGDPTRG